MSAFGALPLDARATPFDALVASSNSASRACPGSLRHHPAGPRSSGRGQAPSLSLDLHDQWASMEKTRSGASRRRRTSSPRSTSPAEHAAEGGGAWRAAPATAGTATCSWPGSGRSASRPSCPTPCRRDHRHRPDAAEPGFQFEVLYDRLSRRGFVIYPRKLTVADSFRIGCIGRLGEAEMRGVLDAIRDISREMVVTPLRAAPAEPAAARSPRTI